MILPALFEIGDNECLKPNGIFVVRNLSDANSCRAVLYYLKQEAVVSVLVDVPDTAQIRIPLCLE